jgi:hypothetical protein
MFDWPFLFTFFTEFLLAFVIGLMIEYLYVNWSGNRTIKRLKNNNFMLLILVATFVILLLRIIADSGTAPPIALALKLLGVLSILRFKAYTALPEDQSFLFLSIAIGVSLGLSETNIILPIFLIVCLAIIFRRWLFDRWVRLRTPPPPPELATLTIISQTLHEKDLSELEILIRSCCPSSNLHWFNDNDLEDMTARYTVFYSNWTQVSKLQKVLRQHDAKMQIAIDF